MTAWNEIKPDMLNANAGTARGAALLRKSVERSGMGKPPLIDADGNVIAGNKTVEVAQEMGMVPRIVDAAPHEVVIVRRADLHLYDPHDSRARDLATADNRVAEVNLSWIDEMLQAAARQCGSTAKQDYWWPDEGEALTVAAAELAQEELPEQEPLDPTKPRQVSRRPVVVIECKDENEQADVCDVADEHGWKWRVP